MEQNTRARKLNKRIKSAKYFQYSFCTANRKGKKILKEDDMFVITNLTRGYVYYCKLNEASQNTKIYKRAMFKALVNVGCIWLLDENKNRIKIEEDK